jgi:hypothetical protein
VSTTLIVPSCSSVHSRRPSESLLALRQKQSMSTFPPFRSLTLASLSLVAYRTLKMVQQDDTERTPLLAESTKPSSPSPSPPSTTPGDSSAHHRLLLTALLLSTSFTLTATTMLYQMGSITCSTYYEEGNGGDWTGHDRYAHLCHSLATLELTLLRRRRYAHS